MLNLEIRSKFLYGYSCENYDHGYVFRYIYIYLVEFEYLVHFQSELMKFFIVYRCYSIYDMGKNRNLCKIYANFLHNISSNFLVNTMTIYVLWFFFPSKYVIKE